jgi:hypothetical protein
VRTLAEAAAARCEEAPTSHASRSSSSPAPPRLDKQLNTHNGQHVHGTSVGAGHVQGLKAHTSAIDGSMVSDSMAGTHSHIITCRRSEVAR